MRKAGAQQAFAIASAIEPSQKRPHLGVKSVSRRRIALSNAASAPPKAGLSSQTGDNGNLKQWNRHDGVDTTGLPQWEKNAANHPECRAFCQPPTGADEWPMFPTLAQRASGASTMLFMHETSITTANGQMIQPVSMSRAPRIDCGAAPADRPAPATPKPGMGVRCVPVSVCQRIPAGPAHLGDAGQLAQGALALAEKSETGRENRLQPSSPAECRRLPDRSRESLSGSNPAADRCRMSGQGAEAADTVNPAALIHGRFGIPAFRRAEPINPRQPFLELSAPHRHLRLTGRTRHAHNRLPNGAYCCHAPPFGSTGIPGTPFARATVWMLRLF